MPRYQFHLAVTDERHQDADPLLIAIINAPSDHEGMELIGELLPDLEYDVAEICCDGCSHSIDDCGCAEDDLEPIEFRFT